jgi:Domain of unknown function (DUF4348)
MENQSFMRILFVLICSFIFVFCKNKNSQSATENAAPTENAVELTKDFVDFYEKFHQDSVFQLAHIQFPLPEQTPERAEDGSISLKLNWSKEEWKIQTLPPLNTGEFLREFTPMNENLMLEKISTTSPEIQYSIDRRWAKMGGEWMLIFYSVGMTRS